MLDLLLLALGTALGVGMMIFGYKRHQALPVGATAYQKDVCAIIAKGGLCVTIVGLISLPLQVMYMVLDAILN
jgi:hypothetical protein